MLRRTLLGTLAVLGLLVAGSGTASAYHGWGHHGHHGYRGGYGYGYRAPVYGYGYRPMVVPAPVVVPPVYGGYGYPGYGYGGYGYGSPYGAGLGYSSPGFGFYMGR